MPREDQLEIISPTGQIEFYSLDPEKGTTNIGRHPDNDIVVDGPGVAAFHALLDHQQKPYRILLLEDVEARLSGKPLAPQVFYEIADWDTLELDGYSLVLMEGQGDAEPRAELPAPAPASSGRPIGHLPQAVPADLKGRPPDQADDVILAELSSREWTVDVEQTASCQLTIVNGGQLVANFTVRVEGLDESWVSLSASQVNLYEGGRTTVTISVTPPRLPGSSAGPHHLVVVVTSANYPGRMSCLGATLHLNPYYEFVVGELSPRRQNVSWRKHSGRASVPVTNKGNGPGIFRLEGSDDEHGCRFEFRVPGEEASLARQAELQLAADEHFLVPVTITPIRRRLVALRSRQYSYTVTTTMVEGGQLPRSVIGSLKARPLIGPLHILVMLIGLVSAILFLFRPGTAPVLLASTTTPEHKQAVTLDYDASRFSSLAPTHVLNNLNGLFLRLILEYRTPAGTWEQVKSPADLPAICGRVLDTPLVNGSYRLRAGNWLSQLVPALEGMSREIPISVTPVEPRIEAFQASPQAIMEGDSVLLYWRVDYAETLILEHDGIAESLTEVELMEGRRTFAPAQDTTYTLIASNSSFGTDIRRPLTVRVIRPTVTPVPTPVILRFDVDPLEIMQGEKVQVNWEVTGADSVSIEHVGQGLPLKGEINDQPQTSTYYQLTAIKAAENGTQVKNTSLLREVLVNPQPTPTAVPLAPIIELFEATPKEVLIGKTVKLTWSVTGETTNVEVTAPDFQVTGLESRETITVTLKETTLFVLTAYNGDLKSSKAVEVHALEPTPTPTLPPPTPVPTPTPTPYPPPTIAYYKAAPFDPVADKVVFETMYDGENGPVFRYEVEVGSRVVLSWQVRNAEQVVVQDLGTQPAEGSVVLPDRIVASGIYILTAINDGGKNTVNAFLQMDVTSPHAPPPPFNVRGTEDAAGGKNVVEWSYRDDDRVLIDGFRIYRALVPPGNEFEMVWTDYNPYAGSWIDEAGRTCGRAYYVVALYTDLVSGEEKETETSPTSWYSAPCP